MPDSTPKSMPHSLEAEKTVLGALLLDPQAILKVLPLLTTQDFFDPVYRKVYEAIEALHNDRSAIDFVTVSEQLKEDQKINEIGGSAFLADLATNVPTSSHIEQYARIVKNKANLRALHLSSQKISLAATSQDGDFSELWTQAQEDLLSLAEREISQKPEKYSDVTRRRYDVFAEVKAGGDVEKRRRLLTGFSNIDYYFNGFEPTSLNIVAGRPGMGKTALMLNMATNAAKQHGKQTLFFSLEMSKEQLTDRMNSAALGISMWDMQRGNISDEKMREYGQVVDAINELPLYLDDAYDSSLTTIRAKALAHQLEYGLDALFVDYLQLIQPPGKSGSYSNRVQEVSAISRELKRMAVELRIPIIAGCQLSRAVELRSPPIPKLSDMRESGTIEQDAENVLMLYRESEYNEDCENPNVTTVYIRKNRQGPTGSADLSFEKEKMVFRPVDRQRAESPATIEL